MLKRIQKNFQHKSLTNRYSTNLLNVPMNSHYLEQKFDLDTLSSKFSKDTNFSKIIKTKRSIFLQFSKEEENKNLPIFEEEFEELRYRKNLSHEEKIVNDEKDSFMTIYSYGSVAFVNVAEKDQKVWTENLQCHQKNNGNSIQDDLNIIVNPDIKNWFKLTKDTLVVQKLNLNNLNIICSVISRSVALKHREKEVDKVLIEFRKLNEGILSKKGSISKKEEKQLVPVIAQSNALQCDLLVNIKLFDRPEVTWNVSQYSDIFECLNEDFEIDERYKIIADKLEFISTSSKFYMESRHSFKSEISEILIIALIFTEIMIAVFHQIH